MLTSTWQAGVVVGSTFAAVGCGRIVRRTKIDSSGEIVQSAVGVAAWGEIGICGGCLKK